MAGALDEIDLTLLVLRCQAGDDGAFVDLVRRFEGRIAYYLRRLVPPDVPVEDLVQEVWLHTYQRLPDLRRPLAFPVWLYHLARNRAVGEMRRRRRWVELGALAEEPAAPEPEEEIDGADVARLHQALRELSPAHGEVLALRFLEAMSYDEIAQVVDCPVGTVRSRLHHARRALRERMEDPG